MTVDEAGVTAADAESSQRQALETLLDERRQRIQALPPDCVAWLALAPVWTLSLARACNFPTGDATVEERVEEMVAAHLCQSEPIAARRSRRRVEGFVPVPGDRSFLMPEPARTEMLKAILSDSARGVTYLQAHLATIGNALQAAGASDLHVPRRLTRWAELAALATDVAAMAARLDDQVDALLAASDEASVGEAERWVEASRPLEVLFANELSLAIDRGVRRIALCHQRIEDARFLARFIERKEQVQAFRDLCALGDVDQWALHYRGEGGAGKTMLARHLAARVAPEIGVVTARIDFDYLNPDYPSKAPGLLLAQLAEELRVQDESGAAVTLFTSFAEKVASHHAKIGDGHGPGARSGTEFEEVLDAFADALRGLGRPSVLILDTCEELARIRLDGTAPDGVIATFDVLERLHERLRDLRVVLLGRRHLSPPSGQGYLRTFSIVGFDRLEAVAYLMEKAEVEASLVEPILLKACDGDRYSPFILAMYGGWARDDPDLTSETVTRADGDRYVEMRIIGRIRFPPLLELLPAAAVLGRFDAVTLRAASPLPDERFDAAFRELCDQEWVATAAPFCQLDDGLHARLLSYFRHSQPSAVNAAWEKGVSYLEDVTLHEPTAALDPSLHFVTLVNLLQAEPVRAAAWWAAVEARLAAEEQHHWAAGLASTLLGTDELLMGEAGQLRAAVEATYAGALAHTQPGSDREPMWAEVMTHADRHPIVEQRERLRCRALAGRVASVSLNGRKPADGDLDRLAKVLLSTDLWSYDEQLAAALLAALEGLYEAGHRPSLPLRLVRAVDTFAETLTIREMGTALQASASVLAGFWSRDGEAWFHRALAQPELDAAVVQRWSDWVAPADLGARVRLCYALFAYPQHRSPSEVLGIVGDHLPPPVTVDADRLGSMVLKLRSAVGPPQDWEELKPDLSRPPEPTRCRAHRAVLPLAAAICELPAAVGRVDRSLEMIAQVRSHADRFHDQALARAANRVTARIVRRFRLRDERFGYDLTLTSSDEAEDWALQAALERLDGRKTPSAPVGSVEPKVPAGGSLQTRLVLHLAGWGVSLETPPGGVLDEAARLLNDGVLPALGRESAPGPGFERVGVRRVAEMALEQGELRSLDDPEAGLRLLRTAALCFRAAKDPVGELISVACAAVTSARLGSRNRTDALPELEEVYRRAVEEVYRRAVLAAVRQQLDGIVAPPIAAGEQHRRPLGYVGLPAWGTLEDAAKERQRSDRFDRLLPIEWRPWLVRIVAYQAWIRDETYVGRSHQVRLWVQDNYGATVDEDRVVPAELEGWMGRRRSRRSQKPAHRILLSALAWAVLGFAAAPAFTLFAYEVEKVVPNLFFLQGLVVVVASLSLSTIIVVPAIAAGTNGRFRIRAVTAESGESTSRAEVDRRLSLRAPSFIWRGPVFAFVPNFAYWWIWIRVKLARYTHRRRNAVSGSEEAVELKPRRSYGALANELPGPLIRGLVVLHKAARTRRRAPIVITVDSRVSRPCWEAAAALAAVPDTVDAKEVRLSFRRRVSGARAVTRFPWPLGQVSSLVDDLSQRSMATEGWQVVTRTGAGDVAFDIIGPEDILQREAEMVSTQGSQRSRASVLHVVGTPVELAAGVRLRIGGTAPITSAEGDTGTSELLRVEKLVRSHPDLLFLVLQAPTGPAAFRGPADREQAGLLRELGAEAFALGVPAVLTLPRLPNDVAMHILDAVGQSFDGRESGWLRRLLKVVSEARSTVAQGVQQAAEDAFETSMDLCLYSFDPLDDYRLFADFWPVTSR